MSGLPASAVTNAAVPVATPEVGTRSRLWALTGGNVLVVGWFCLLFLYHNYLPLFHSDLWGHVAYGDWMLREGRLPAEDPFTELAAGVPVVHTAWLSQIILAWAGRGADVEGLAHLFAVMVLLTSLVLSRAVYDQTGRAGVAVVGAMLAFAIPWSRHAVQRPEMFGHFCIALLLWLVVRSGLLTDTGGSRRGWARRYAGVLILFAAWANLHGSFVVGLGLLAALVLGVAIDRGLAMGRWFTLIGDRRVQRSLWLLELGILGACLNPHGFDLLVQTLAFPAHSNLTAVLEWFPLEMTSLEGIPMAASWVLAAVVLRHSQRRITATETLWLLLMSAAVCLRVRMIAWYGPVLAIVLAPHLANICERLAPTADARLTCLSRRSPTWTALAVLLVWCTFSFSPISRPVLGGQPRRPAQLFSHQTPLGATGWLRDHPPKGLVFAPQWWGDWLVWQGPPGLRVMATTNAIHLLPASVWQDYLAISTAEGGLDDRFNRYRINTVVVSLDLQPELAQWLERSRDWNVAYEDARSLIAVRSAVEPSAAAPTNRVARHVPSVPRGDQP